MNISILIYEKRKSKNLTQKELGSILNVSSKTISHWENNRSYPDISLIPKVCKALDIPLDAFFDVEKQNTKRSENKYMKYLIPIYLLISIIFLLITIIVSKNIIVYKVSIIISLFSFIISGILFINNYFSIGNIENNIIKNKIFKIIIINTILYFLITFIASYILWIAYFLELPQSVFLLIPIIINYTIIRLIKKKIGFSSKKTNISLVVIFASSVFLILIPLLKNNMYINSILVYFYALLFITSVYEEVRIILNTRK